MFTPERKKVENHKFQTHPLRISKLPPFYSKNNNKNFTLTTNSLFPFSHIFKLIIHVHKTESGTNKIKPRNQNLNYNKKNKKKPFCEDMQAKFKHNPKNFWKNTCNNRYITMIK